MEALLSSKGLRLKEELREFNPYTRLFSWTVSLGLIFCTLQISKDSYFFLKLWSRSWKNLAVSNRLELVVLHSAFSFLTLRAFEPIVLICWWRGVIGGGPFSLGYKYIGAISLLCFLS